MPYYGPDSSGDIACTYQSEFTYLTSTSGKFTGIELGGFLAGALTKVSKTLITTSLLARTLKLTTFVLNSNEFGASQLVNFVVRHMSEAISQFLENELINGTGTNACQGILTGTTNILTSTGAAISADDLIDLQESTRYLSARVCMAYEPIGQERQLEN